MGDSSIATPGHARNLAFPVSGGRPGDLSLVGIFLNDVSTTAEAADSQDQEAKEKVFKTSPLHVAILVG